MVTLKPINMRKVGKVDTDSRYLIQAAASTGEVELQRDNEDPYTLRKSEEKLIQDQPEVPAISSDLAQRVICCFSAFLSESPPGGIFFWAL